VAEELTRGLLLLADRGTPRGAIDVLDAAYRNVEVAPVGSGDPWHGGDVEARRMTPSRRLGRAAFAFAAGMMMVLIVIGGWALLMGSRSGEVADTTPADSVSTTAASVTTTIPESTTVPPEAAESPISWVGVDWSQVSDTAGVFGGEGAQFIEAVTIGGPGFVAVGSDCGGGCGVSADDGWDAAVWVSADAVDWTRIPHDEPVFGGAGSQNMIDVVSAGPGLVVVGIIDHAYAGARRSPFEIRPDQVFVPSGRDDIDAAVWVSPDGLTWERVPDPDGVFSGPGSFGAADEAMEAVAVGNGLIVAVGSADANAAVWVSSDGLSWQRVPNDDEIFGGSSGQSMHDVIYTGERFVAVGTDLNGAGINATSSVMRGAVWTSEDGWTWSRVQHTDEVFGGDYPFNIWTVAATDDGLVAAGTSPRKMALWWSEDGLEWQRIVDESAPFAFTKVKRFPNNTELRHAPVKALAAVGDRVLPVGWDRDAAQVLSRETANYFEHDLVYGQLNTTVAKTDVVVIGDRIIAVGYTDGDAAVWVGTIAE
jgi:hypothetical protein